MNRISADRQRQSPVLAARGVASRIVRVSGGDLEFAEIGNGLPVLVSHGTLGGYDQALAVTRLFNREKFRFLAVSRAGYLRSDLGTGRTPAEQARSFAELLEQAGIKNTAVLGLSGGAPAALSFALHFPERCRALALLSSITAAPPQLPAFFRLAVRLQPITLGLDPLWGLVHRYGLGLLVRSNGVSPEQATRILADPRLAGVLAGIFRPVATASARRRGVRLDEAQIQGLPAGFGKGIRPPLLIGHAGNDPLAPPQAAARLASANPQADYHPYSDGGHLFFVVHNATVVPAVEGFWLANAP
jgi:pimeloyl-ACP methyl ester carboxylesterase